MIGPLPAAGPDARRVRQPSRVRWPWLGWFTVLAGVLALAWAATLYQQAQPTPNVGTDAARALASQTPPPADRLGQSVPVRTGVLPDPRHALAPVRLRIPAIRVDVAVVPVGVDAKTGELAVPASVDMVGWYALGPNLASPTGSVVIAGHVDAYDQGAGAFFRLRDLRPGAGITVVDSAGRDHRYRVVAREQYPKASVPVDRIFTTDGAYRLALITCGGHFDRRTRSYTDNVVVTAVPID